MLPGMQICQQSSLAQAPGLIDLSTIIFNCSSPLNIEALPGIKTQYKVSLGLSWEPPQLFHGSTQYEVSISDKAVSSDGSQINNPLTIMVMVCNAFTNIIAHDLQQYDTTFSRIKLRWRLKRRLFSCQKVQNICLFRYNSSLQVIVLHMVYCAHFFRFVPEMSFSGAITVIRSSSHLVRRSSLPAVRTKHTIIILSFISLNSHTHTQTSCLHKVFLIKRTPAMILCQSMS